MTIRTDSSRLLVVAKDKRRPRSVASRQGQVLMDTDFSEEARHLLDRTEIETQDVLGSPHRLLVPAGNTGFQITPSGAPANFDIGTGHGYLDGWLLENAASCKLTTQPHPRTGDTVNAPVVITFKALIRHVDPVEEPIYADVALGDAQASGRALIDWQVFPFALAGASTATCATVMTDPGWKNLVAPSTGTLAVLPQLASPSTDPCSLTPGGGYTRLENLLYRFEVHDGDVNAAYPTIDGPRFNLHNLKIKFSRRNASMLVRIANIAGTEITVTPPVLDPRNWFAPGSYAEIVSLHDDVDPRNALAPIQRLYRVALARDDKVTLEDPGSKIAGTGVTADGTWFLRLWDAFPSGDGAFTVSAPGSASESAEIDLGDGLKIKLGGGAAAIFRRGDFWTCAARADGSVDWPMSGSTPLLVTPHGPETRYAPLAVGTATATGPFVVLNPDGTPVPGRKDLTTVGFEDCRIPFATLTDRAVLYRGGDGQSVFAPAGSTMVVLPGKARVAVMRGETPVPNARVRWSFVGPAGSSCRIDGAVCDAANSPETVTDLNGLAEVGWAIDAGRQTDAHQMQAVLVTDSGTSRPPVLFTATFETAAHTGYTPGKCDDLKGVDNVQDALDTLCLRSDRKRALNLVAAQLVGSPTADIVDKEFIYNGLETGYLTFIKGIAFGFDFGPLGMSILPYDPIIEVELDLPYPITDPEKVYWAKVTAGQITAPFGYQRVRLDGIVEVMKQGPNGAPSGLSWRPTAQSSNFLQSAPRHIWGQAITPDFAAPLKDAKWVVRPNPRVMCRLRLRSALIWADDKETGERLYLNAEYLGVVGPKTKRELSPRVRDEQRAGDIDIFFYLVVGDRQFPEREGAPLTG